MVKQATAVKETVTSRGSDRTCPRKTASWVAWWFALLMTATIAVRLVDPVGWLGSDDASYHCAAEHVLAGQPFQRVHHHFARSPMVVAVAASMWLFGESPRALALPMLITSVVCVALVAILGRLLWGWWEGLCAATVLSFIPVFQNSSTCVLPGAYVCFWATLAILLAVVASRTSHGRWAILCTMSSGVAVGLATSTKLFAGLTALAVFVILWGRLGLPRRKHVAWLGCAALGALMFFVLEGAFHSRAAGDFWYKLHAVEKSTVVHAEWAGEATAYDSLASTAQIIGDRLTMPMRTEQSGWGVIGMAFWPAMIAVLFFDRRGRGLALWATATYLYLAFVPIGTSKGLRLSPDFCFNGANLSVLCVPFALCLAWALHRVGGLVVHPATIQRSWPILLTTIVVISTLDRARYNRSLDFRQRDLARAIGRLVVEADWHDHHEIFMTSSLYWRYRILFPSDLRPRLRVAAENDAPAWWRDTTVDMVSRWRPLPPPGEVYLAVTPRQLNGQCHFWDYGVGLPGDRLEAWKGIPPALTVSRFDDGSIDFDETADGGTPILLLLAGDTTPAARVAHTKNRAHVPKRIHTP